MPIGVNIPGIIAGIGLFVKCYIFLVVIRLLTSPLHDIALDWQIDVLQPQLMDMINFTMRIGDNALLICAGIGLLYILLSGLGIVSVEEVID